MKKLFKNSFFSFFKNKLAISLLMIIVFLTTATFTMFNSATHAFKKSYDQVMTEGNRHEYTIKEMYNIDGDAVFTTPVAETGTDSTYSRDEHAPITTSDSYYKYNGKDYVLVPLNAIFKSPYGDSPLSGVVLVEPTNASTGMLKIIVPYSADFMGLSLFANKAALAANAQASFSKEINLASGYTNLSIGTNDFMGPLAIDISTTPTDLIAAAKAELAKAFTINSVQYQKYTFGLDDAKSSEIYQNLNAVNKYKYELGIPASVTTPDWTSQSISTINSNFDGDKLEQWQTSIRASLYDSAKFKMHLDLLNKLDSYKDKNQQAELIYKDVESVQVSSNSEIFKFVKENKSEVDKIKIFEGGSLPASLTTDELNHKLVSDATDKYLANSTDPYWSRIFSLVGQQQKIINTGWSSFVTDFDVTYRVMDPSSFAAVVSPTYAANKGIKPMSMTTYNNILSDKEFIDVLGDPSKTFVDIRNIIDKIVPANEKSAILYAGNTPFFILGTGITPDFAFPIISAENPLPNTSNQAIIYANNAGYARIEQANKGSQKENYIAYTFAKDVNAARRAEIQADVVAYANKVTSWPTGINAVEKYDSDSENVLMTPSRVTFLEKLNHTISSVSWIVTSLLVLFTAFIVALVIKKQIDNRKKQLGILMANGYSKLEIASSMMVIGLIVAVIPALAGYLFGHFMQFALMNIFSNYWTLPIWNTQFSWIALVVTVVAPLAGMSLLAFIISLYTLRGRIPDILAGETTKSGFITKQIMRPVKYFGIKTKMGMSLVFSNVGKLSIAFVAFAASIIALSVSMNSIGKFNYAQQQSEAATDYEYQVDLVTPTVEAGLYSDQTIDNIYYSAFAGKKINYSEYSQDYTKLIPTMEAPTGNVNGAAKDIDHHEDAIMLHAASGIDATFATSQGKYFPYYLKNRIQIKELLNLKIDATSNPWQIASQLMPENQRNTADIKSLEFIDFAARNYKIDNPGDFDALIKAQAILEKNGRYEIASDLSKLAIPNQYQFTAEYKKFIAYGLAKATKNYINGDRSTPLPYFMTYNNVLVDKGDELYTHIDIDLTRKNVNGEIKVNPLKIRGLNDAALKAHQSKIHLSDSSISALEANKPADANAPVPIVINKYFSEYYKIGNGDKFSAPISNMSDRFISDSKPTREFKVVGIENTYNDGKVYTLQNYANDALGMTQLLAKSPLAKVPFNGVMTNEEKPMIFNSMALYSPSGVYPGKNFISATVQEASYQSIDKAFFDPSITADKGGQLVFPNPKVTSMSQFIKTYGTDTSITPMSALYSTVDWSKVSDYQFTSIMDLSSALMNTVQIIVMFIALAFVLLISTMIIADNTKFIATLKVMGYRTKEISRIFLATFIPSLLLALAISIPLVFGLEEAIRVGIMGFGHVLIPLYIAGWEIAAAFGILVIGFLAMYFISLRGLKNTSLLQAFQE